MTGKSAKESWRVRAAAAALLVVVSLVLFELACQVWARVSVFPELQRIKVHALHPDGLRAHVLLYETVMRGTPSLPKVDRELLALRVSQINQCHY